jgi:alkanesulfonate monooxygenase SsuD/methylene tetrahydromethanopterin reductase-like flavin-dependent oxidoreductase (luciferase family)
MRAVKVGLVLPMLEAPPTGEKPTWTRIRSMALTAERHGFDTVWVPDELLWKVPSWPGPRGWWECVAVVGAVAEVTSTVEVGTWVLSALHRNPALIAKTVETVDEIAGGRFVFGFGSGHAGSQADGFGYPSDRIVGRYVEALEIVVALLRHGSADVTGEFHRAVVEQRPRGPRPGGIPIMLGAHGPRTMRIAAEHADIWSAFATESSLPEAFTSLVARFEEACAEVGRDPAEVGRSVGVVVQPMPGPGAAEFSMGTPITGSPAEIADTIAAFADVGFTRVEVMLWPGTEEALERFAPAIDLLG